LLRSEHDEKRKIGKTGNPKQTTARRMEYRVARNRPDPVEASLPDGLPAVLELRAGSAASRHSRFHATGVMAVQAPSLIVECRGVGSFPMTLSWLVMLSCSDCSLARKTVSSAAPSLGTLVLKKKYGFTSQSFCRPLDTDKSFRSVSILRLLRVPRENGSQRQASLQPNDLAAFFHHYLIPVDRLPEVWWPSPGSEHPPRNSPKSSSAFTFSAPAKLWVPADQYTATHSLTGPLPAVSNWRPEPCTEGRFLLRVTAGLFFASGNTTLTD